MRILLIAYEFPPSPSPQSLRWAYLVRELSRMGQEVHVLAPSLSAISGEGLPEIPESVRVHTSSPGTVRSALTRLQSFSARLRGASRVGDAVPVEPESNTHTSVPLAQAPPVKLNWKGKTRQAGLNWKGRILTYVAGALARRCFPDERGEWLRPASVALKRLLPDIDPDVVVSSHEPATTLELGLMARRMGYRWIADLGDPVLAPYTPPRWRTRAQALERRVCHSAEHVTVTTERARALLVERHDVDATCFSILTQGFDDVEAPIELAAGFRSQPLELLYTGSFYAFRCHEALVQAVARSTGVRLSVASVAVPESLRQAALEHPDKFRLFGFLPHRTVVALQRHADVLVNIANADASQVPGKFYEYLGSGRPILHLTTQARHKDAAAVLIDRLERGVVVDDSPEAICVVLDALLEARRARGGDLGFALDPERVAEFGWSALARDLAAVIDRVAAMPIRGVV